MKSMTPTTSLRNGDLMKAILCSHWCEPDALVLGEVPDPVAGPGEVVITIKAAALNFFDILMVQGKYQTKPPFPFSPASEIAGVIESVGAGVTGFKPGDRVISYLGYNGAREKVAAPADQTMKIPDGLDYDRAAGLIIIYATALHALQDRADPTPGETMVVLGAAGGTGLAAIEIGKLLGLRVVACASSDEKLQFCKKYGADVLFNYAKDDLKDGLKKIGGAKGIDIVFDPVGGDFTEAALRSLGWEGRLLVIGFAAGPIPRIPLNLALLKSCDIRGVFWGAFNKNFPEQSAGNFRKIIQWAAEGKISSHVHATFPLAQAAEAMKVLSSRQAMGKVILHP
jgi:NADPH2:quinone reductase